jgi:class 3 adenylate cyclase
MSDARKRLATILALDVAGYSRASERDDAAIAAAVAALRIRIEGVIEPFGGRVFSTAGDGFMMEFPSADAGVRAATALLAASKSRQAGQYPVVSVDPDFDGLRANPRYRALAERCRRSH